MYALGVDVGTAQIILCSLPCDVADVDRRRGKSVLSDAIVENTSAAAFVTDDGAIVVGGAAERLGLHDPENLVRGYVERVGDPVGILAGHHVVSGETVLAAVITDAIERGAKLSGGPPIRVGITHPAHWGPFRVAALEAALRCAGIEHALLVPDAVAAAGAVTEEHQEAHVLAVFGLGATTARAAVVVRSADGLEVAGRPQITEHVGGASFDDLLLGQVCLGAGVGFAAGRVDRSAVDRSAIARSAAVTREAVRTLRAQCSAAKEALSIDTDAVVPVEIPGRSTRIRVVRSEFEDLIRPAVADALDVLLEAMASAEPDCAGIDAVLLTGGSSRIPLVVQTVSAATRLPIIVDEHPAGITAVGAARCAAEYARQLARSEREAALTVPAAAAVPESPDPADAVRAVEAPLAPAARRRGRKRALVTAVLAAALFAASAIAAPRFLESGGDGDGGVPSGPSSTVSAPGTAAATGDPAGQVGLGR